MILPMPTAGIFTQDNRPPFGHRRDWQTMTGRHVIDPVPPTRGGPGRSSSRVAVQAAPYGVPSTARRPSAGSSVNKASMPALRYSRISATDASGLRAFSAPWRIAGGRNGFSGRKV